MEELFCTVRNIYSLTHDFAELKRKFYPDLFKSIKYPLDAILVEIKGSKIRKDFLAGNRNKKRHAQMFIRATLNLLERKGGRLCARIYIKKNGAEFKETKVYGAAIGALCHDLNSYAKDVNEYGICFCDSRNKPKNSKVAHSLFTEKYSRRAPAFSKVLELPAFMHSENSAGLQIIDLICSSILFPLAANIYCSHVKNVHVQERGIKLREYFGNQLKNLQFRYFDPEETRWRGGIVVSDPVQGWNSTLLFSNSLDKLKDHPFKNLAKLK